MLPGGPGPSVGCSTRAAAEAVSVDRGVGRGVTGLLEADWSPQQVAAMLPLLYPQDEAGRVSHETIYRSLFVQGRGELRRELGSTPANSTELVGAPLTRTLITEEGPVSDRRARK